MQSSGIVLGRRGCYGPCVRPSVASWLPDCFRAPGNRARKIRDGPRFSRRLRDLDQVQVRIAHVDRAQLRHRSGFCNGSFNNGNAGFSQLLNYFIQRHGSDEAKIERSGNGNVGARRELLAPLVQVDLLVAELERESLLGRGAEALELHAEHLGVEAYARSQVARGEHDMVDVVDHQMTFRFLKREISSRPKPME